MFCFVFHPVILVSNARSEQQNHRHSHIKVDILFKSLIQVTLCGTDVANLKLSISKRIRHRLTINSDYIMDFKGIQSEEV